MNKPNNMVLINGIPADFLNINDRAIHYGDGLFETILCRNGKLLYWKQHYQRLQSSAVRLKMYCPDESLLLDDIKTIFNDIDRAANNNFAIKIIISRGAGEPGYQFKPGNNLTRVLMASAIDADYSSLAVASLLTGDLYICEQQVSINEGLAGIKHLNRLENVLARNEWHTDAANNKIIDGLMLNANHHVIEATMSNLFVVKDGQLITPDLKQSGVNGIMRDVIIDIASNNKIESAVINLTLEEMITMDECFITNSLIGMKLVNNIADHKFPSDSITKLLFSNLLDTIEEHAQIV